MDRSGLSTVLAHNIRIMERRRHREEAAANPQERVADAITRFTGSMRFVYLHIVLFGLWILVYRGQPPATVAIDWSPATVARSTVGLSPEAIASPRISLSKTKPSQSAQLLRESAAFEPALS